MQSFKELSKDLPLKKLGGNLDDPKIMINSLEYDSRKVKPGALFVAIKGLKYDGHDFINEAINKGARVIVIQKEVINFPEKGERARHDYTSRGQEKGAEYFFSPDTREILALLAVRFYNRPSQKLKLIGVTGTNGKTTTTHILKSIFDRAGYKTGLIGTINYRIKKKSFPSIHTTPESVELQSLLHKMFRAGVEYCFLEVSSHALKLKRTWGSTFNAGIFTNLTPEHLDFHRSPREYFSAKSALFTDYNLPLSIINRDDPWAEKLIPRIKNKRITFALNQQADVRAEHISLSRQYSAFILKTKKQIIPLCSKLIGRYNISNLLAAGAYALSQNIPSDYIRQGIEKIKNVPGRFERLQAGQNFTLIIDYAHTPDALKNILLELKRFTSGRIILVFGCGGERDRLKRPLMGKIAGRLADFTLLTSDNPRNENPEDIIAEIEKGIKKISGAKGKYTIISERKRAIEYALGLAQRKDTVLIAGKGHEDYQLLKNKRIDFDDRKVVRQILKGTG